eukprot:scaffold160684_cov43-Prasinocladus_malaysianus.AAC.1
MPSRNPERVSGEAAGMVGCPECKVSGFSGAMNRAAQRHRNTRPVSHWTATLAVCRDRWMNVVVADSASQ